jgi:ATP/ADP translocase
VKKSVICVDKILNILFNPRIFYIAVTFTSSIFLIATFVVYAIIPEIRNTPGANVMCFVASTASAYISFGIVNSIMELSKPACGALGNGLNEY